MFGVDFDKIKQKLIDPMQDQLDEITSNLDETNAILRDIFEELQKQNKGPEA